MKLNFDYINTVSKRLHAMSQQEPDAYYKGNHVYEIRFTPSTGKAEIFMQWPMFRNLIANEADGPVEVDCLNRGTKHASLHIIGKVQGVEVRTCVDKQEVIDDLRALELPADYEIDESADIVDLFIIWQNMTGWNLDWEAKNNG